MCGIAGIIYKTKETIPVEERLSVFKEALFHRGPDSHGAHQEEKACFLNRRLAIVDIAGGDQPIYSEDGTVGVVYNGEIYNYLPYREELIKKGHQFKTHSDTEVIVHLYEEYGVESFAKFNGMFGFCLWDKKKNVTYLVRDHIGIKPLYVYEDAEKLIFASELKGILAFSDVDLSLNPLGLQDYLMFRYVHAPHTVFRNIRRMDSGTYLEIKNGRAAQYRYWDVAYQDPYPQPHIEEVKKELEKKLEYAVSSQLMGEVPIGVLLSGGIDSSTIAYFVHKLGANLTTFNIGFPEVNEFEFSDAVAQKYNLKHVKVVMTVEELLERLDEVVLALDEPIADPACFPLYRLAEELKKQVTVVLSGEGGDELFAGYPQYGTVMKEKRPYGQQFQHFMERSWYFLNHPQFLRNKTLPPDTLRHHQYFEEQPRLNGMLAYDMKTWIPDNLMMKADKIMMAHSLEGRFPFLDRDLFEYVAQLPQSYKLAPDGTTKWILKEIITPYLPESIIKRPKMGFTVPVDRFLEVHKAKVMNVFQGAKKSLLNEYLNIEQMEEAAKNYYRYKKIFPMQIWTLFVLCYWFQFALPQYKKAKSLLPARRLTTAKP